MPDHLTYWYRVEEGAFKVYLRARGWWAATWREGVRSDHKAGSFGTGEWLHIGLVWAGLDRLGPQ